jgi:hypothetical protein
MLRSAPAEFAQNFRRREAAVGSGASGPSLKPAPSGRKPDFALAYVNLFSKKLRCDPDSCLQPKDE